MKPLALQWGLFGASLAQEGAKWCQDDRRLEQKGTKSSHVGQKGGKNRGTWSEMVPRWAKMGPTRDNKGQKGGKRGLKVELRRAMTDHNASNRRNARSWWN